MGGPLGSSPTTPLTLIQCPYHLCCSIRKLFLKASLNKGLGGLIISLHPQTTAGGVSAITSRGSSPRGQNTPRPPTLPALSRTRAKATDPSTLLSPHSLQISGTCFPIFGTDACLQMRARNVGTEGFPRKQEEKKEGSSAPTAQQLPKQSWR